MTSGHGAGLGPNAQRVYTYLAQDGPVTVAEISCATGLSRNGLSRKNDGILQRLQEWGLADRKDDEASRGRCAWVALDADLDRIAQERGALGRRVQLRELHQREREHENWVRVQEHLRRRG